MLASSSFIYIYVFQYQLIYYPKIEKIRFFDLKNDPQEMHDLAGDSGYESKVAELKTALAALQKEMGDPLVKNN